MFVWPGSDIRRLVWMGSDIRWWGVVGQGDKLLNQIAWSEG